MTSCRSHKSMYQNYSTVTTTIIAPEGSGDYVLRVQGRGVTQAKALENARRQAVHDVLFSNLYTTYGDHKMIKAIFNDPSAEEKYDVFFNKFFESKWKKFAKETAGDKDEQYNDKTKTVVVNVLVKRVQLREYVLKELDLK